MSVVVEFSGLLVVRKMIYSTVLCRLQDGILERVYRQEFM